MYSQLTMRFSRNFKYFPMKRESEKNQPVEYAKNIDSASQWFQKIINK